MTFSYVDIFFFRLDIRITYRPYVVHSEKCSDQNLWDGCYCAWFNWFDYNGRVQCKESIPHKDCISHLMELKLGFRHSEQYLVLSCGGGVVWLLDVRCYEFLLHSKLILIQSITEGSMLWNGISDTDRDGHCCRYTGLEPSSTETQLLSADSRHSERLDHFPNPRSQHIYKVKLRNGYFDCEFLGKIRCERMSSKTNGADRTVMLAALLSCTTIGCCFEITAFQQV